MTPCASAGHATSTMPRPSSFAASPPPCRTLNAGRERESKGRRGRDCRPLCWDVLFRECSAGSNYKMSCCPLSLGVSRARRGAASQVSVRACHASQIYIHQIITYIHTCIHTCMHACMQVYVHTYVHKYICTHIRIYIHTYIHTYMQKKKFAM
jgi:hypothetical protein